MNDKKSKPGISSLALGGFIAGMLTVFLVFLAMKGC
jgi:hypothetical protein